jgi:hypothetical protein
MPKANRFQSDIPDGEECPMLMPGRKQMAMRTVGNTHELRIEVV